MNKRVYINSYDVISSLGKGVDANWSSLSANKSGIKLSPFKNESIPLAHITSCHSVYESYTRLESLIIDSISACISQTDYDYGRTDFLLILSTTKGNIDVLQADSVFPKERAQLGQMALKIQKYFNLYHTPILISNACVSGVLAVGLAQKYLRHNLYSKVLVCGADLISDFVTEGFRSFKALSHTSCKPFDTMRAGINLGESVSSILLSTSKNHDNDIAVIASSSSNDANHISGPSRNASGLTVAIKAALLEAQIDASQLDFISAHGTATVYNDEMESIAINAVQCGETPVNSFKSYIGHTLGAAGVTELIYSVLCMKNNLLIKSLGYDSSNLPVHIVSANQTREIDRVLKLSSGFGGCNAVLILSK